MKYKYVIVSTVGFLITVIFVRAAVDCGVLHPNGCEHKTTQGTEACDDDGAATCSGASESKCAVTTGKQVEQFPKVISDASAQKECGSEVKDVWTGHHYISNTSENCSRTFECKWNASTGECEKDTLTYSGWSQTDHPESNECEKNEV